MSNQVLNAREIENRLARRGSSGRAAGEQLLAAADDSIKSTDRFLWAIAALHYAVAGDLAAGLSALCRGPVTVRLVRVERTEFQAFIKAVEKPCAAIVLASPQLSGKLLLEFQSSMLYPVIDRMLGAGTEPSPVVRRPLTEIESRLVARIASGCLVTLSQGWSEVAELALSVERVETNPRQLEITAADAPVVSVAYEIVMERARGAMRLCIPLAAIEPIRGKLPGCTADDVDQPVPSPAPTTAGESTGWDTHVTVAVRLPECQVQGAELEGLRPGDIITTSQDVAGLWTVVVDGIEKFRAQAGTLDGRKAVRIEAPIQAPEE